ncbi:MAG: hypothetical protein ACFB21_12885 [Opitutales bacterium]
MKIEPYNERIQKLTRLGEPKFREPWRDYAAEFGLTEADRDEVIRMFEDTSWYDLKPKNPAYWSGIHAGRALAFLGPDEDTFTALICVLEENPEDDWLCEDVPEILGRLGEPALLAVTDYLNDPHAVPEAKCSLADFYNALIKHHRALKPTALAALRRLIADFNRHDPAFNGLVVAWLIELMVKSALPSIRIAYLSNKVEPSICGYLEDVEAKFREM